MVIKLNARTTYGFIAFIALFFTSIFVFLLSDHFSSVRVDDTSLYILDILVSEHNRSRFKITEKSWIKDLKKQIPSTFFAVGASHYTKGYQMIIYKKDPKENYRPFSIVKPFISGMKDFMENTNKRWFLRITDDVFVNVKGLKKMMREYEEKYDPLKEVVVKGSLIKFMNGETEVKFLHGGSGWIMSRYAVSKYLRLEMEMATMFERTGDDVLVSRRFQNNLEWNLSSMNDPRFVGTPLDNFSITMLQNLRSFNRSTLPTCIESHITTRVNDIVIWHSGEPFMTVVTEGEKIFTKNILNDVYLQRGLFNRDLQLCSRGNKTKVL